MFAGEVAAFASETILGAVRASGSRVITGDDVFSSGQPFRFPPGSRGKELPGVIETDGTVTEGDVGSARVLALCNRMIEGLEPSELLKLRDMIDQVLLRRAA
jgi:hypothetical protein